MAFFEGVHDICAAYKTEHCLASRWLKISLKPRNFAKGKKTIASMVFHVYQRVEARVAQRQSRKGEQRRENQETHPGCLLYVNENASLKTLVSSKDREALTTATSSTHKGSMKPSGLNEQIAANLLTAKKFVNSATPLHSRSPIFHMSLRLP